VNRSSFILLLVLGALWGASFLFLRIAAPVLGAVWLIEIRVLIAGLVLLPLVVFNRQWISMLSSYRHLLIVGALNSALPFVLIAYITIELSAGATSILNAIVPIAGVVFSYLVMKEQLGLAQLCGIALGFVGVLVLMLWQQQGVSSPSLLVVVLAIIAAFSYVAGAHYTKQRLVKMPVMVYVAGTQLAAAILLQYDLVGKDHHLGNKAKRRFNLVVIDEAFARGSKDSTRFGLELFKKLGLQLLLVTPLQKLDVIEHYVKHVHFVDQKENRSILLNMSIAQYRQKLAQHKELKQYQHLVKEV